MDDALLYSLGGLGVGATCVLLGFALVYFGRNGTNIWVLEIGRLRVQITTRTPGVILATIGLLIILATRLRS